MSTNEELAVAIQAGRTDLMAELWTGTRRFIARYAIQWQDAAAAAGMTVDDLTQEAYSYSLRALKTYRADRGTYLAWLSYYLRLCFADAIGRSHGREDHEPLNTAASLDAPLTDDGGAFTLADTIADPSDAFAEIEQQERTEAVSDALDCLTVQERKAIILIYWDGLSLEQAGRRMGISRQAAHHLKQTALRRLRDPRVSKKLRAYL